jgi:hypothetical protein
MPRNLRLFDVVAILEDRKPDGLRAGQVGTIVEVLDRNTMLVEFSDDSGAAYKIAPLPIKGLLKLAYTAEAAE